MKEGRNLGRGRVGVEMGRESDARRCGGGCKERGERTWVRVNDVKGRKGSDSGECEGVQQKKGG